MKLDINFREKLVQIVIERVSILKMRGIAITPEKIASIIEVELQMNGADSDNEDIQYITQEIEYYAQIKHTTESVIFDDYDDVRDWYTNSPNKNGEFWNHYKRYLGETGDLDANSINKLEWDTLPNLMNCLSDPVEHFEGNQWRRGLVIGDVQSGKTATYAGLICKAADAGYKVVILLTGITETLRRQTQERMEEDIIGYTVRYVPRGLKKELQRDRVGVGKYPHNNTATAFTSYQDDFKKNVNSIATSLKSHNTLVMFVVKKNVKILENLYNWLVDLNQDVLDGMIHAPMLLIDDEADNASVNTNKDDLDPTKTNAVIRKICQAFKNSNYVGFTATPFANVFIDPDSVDEMVKEDLFPKHFIYVLPTPSSYIGAKKLFYPEQPLYKKCIKFITDIVEPSREEILCDSNADIRPLYYKHGKNWHGSFPDSLEESVHCFYLANVIRDLRHDNKKPRTMMINVSRFVNVHRYIVDYLKQLYNLEINTIRTDFDDDFNKNNSISLWNSLKLCYDKHYSACGFPIEDVLDKQNLLNAIGSLLILCVNSGSDADKLDYKKTPDLRCIAVGGLSLSRGLTLSGLMTSYFYRNTSTFDVLMQMGRWFGYRHNYEDLCQIWTSETSAEYYKEVSISTEELKDDIKRMYEDKLTPKDFGIKVHNISEELQITSSNKMRHSYDKVELLDFWGKLFETPYVNQNVDNNIENLKQVDSLLSKIVIDENLSLKVEKEGGTTMVKNVPFEYVKQFLLNIKVSLKNQRFYHEEMKQFLMEDKDKKLLSWDVVFFSGKSEQRYKLDSKHNLQCISRTIKTVGAHIGFTGSSGRLGSKTDGLYAINGVVPEKELLKAQEQYRNEFSGASDMNRSDYPCLTWFRYITDRNPCLMIYLVAPSKDNFEKEQYHIKYIDELKGSPIVGIGVGFPKNGDGSSLTKKYKINKVYQLQLLEEAGDDDE